MKHSIRKAGVVCVVGAVLGLLIAARDEHTEVAEELAPEGVAQQRSRPRPMS